MKKLIKIVIASMLMGSFFAVPAQGAAKVGGKCVSINSKTVVKKVNLVCALTGSKLKWINGSNLTTYATGPTGRMVYRVIDGKQQRLSSAKDWLKTDARKDS